MKRYETLFRMCGCSCRNCTFSFENNGFCKCNIESDKFRKKLEEDLLLRRLMMGKSIVHMDADTILMVSMFIDTLPKYNVTMREVDEDNCVVKDKGEQQMIGIEDLKNMLSDILAKPYFVVPENCKEEK